MTRFVVALCVGAVVLAGCGPSAPQVGTDAGPLDTVTSAATAAPQPTPGPPQGTEPVPDPTSPPTGSESPSEDPSSQPSETPSDIPSGSPSATPADPPSGTPSDSPVRPPDLELDGWDVRVVGVIDPARANVLNAFVQRPVVVVVHAQAATLAAPEGEEPADDAAIVDLVEVQLALDQGQSLDEVEPFAGATTVECPAQVERRAVLRAGQGQRMCVVFDVPGTAEVDAVAVATAGQTATVDIADIEQIESISAMEMLDVGVPESLLALGEVVDVTLDGDAGDVTMGMAVTATQVIDDEDGRLVGITVELTSDVAVTGVRLEPEMFAALSPDGVQRTRLLDETTADCRGTGTIDVPAGDAVSFCVPVLVPDEAITSHARFLRVGGPPQVWRVLRAGGTAGPGSNA